MRTPEQRHYALKRVSKAVDRQIMATTEEERHISTKWINAWARVAGIKR